MVSHPCRKAFSAADPVREIPFDGFVIKEPALTVRAIHLDHGIPVLAFALEERFHINIVKDRLSQLGLLPGPWLNRFKSMLYCDADPEATIAVSSTNATETALQMPIRALKHAIARISPGQRLAYIVDVGGTPENLKRITDFAAGVDHLFVEAAFAHIHHEIAIRKNHLTARQAGALARSCRVKQYSLFHFSPRYTHCPDMLEAEAKKAFTKGSSIVGDG